MRCALGRWPIHHFYDDSSVETLGSHPVRPALLGISMSPCFPLWDAFWTLGLDFVIDLDDQDHAFDERWFHATYSSDLSHIRCHIGAYFHFGWDLTDLHGGHMLDDRCFHVTCSSDLSYIRCHTGAYFHFGWDLRIFTEVTCSMINDFMSPVLLTCHTSNSVLGYIFVSNEIYGSSRRSHVRR